ncbi:hypothetical protein Cgig2_030112 [Carnegiea gigantea]|uniref:Uncharacterized protein n=1 Tax=Carnegiea gigantea TaxID=171969 RepID=A0A9Q1Q6W1_9CARY|nr:hypothetical protein Cgig2_030112 [Carnegiea gigantea]
MWSLHRDFRSIVSASLLDTSSQDILRLTRVYFSQALQCSSDNAALKHLENEARANYISILSSSLAFLRQQCKMDWISYGDDSTRFFFAKAKQRKLTTYIYSIHDASDNEVEGFDLVGDVLFSYYRDHLGKASMRRAPLDPATIEQGATLSMEQQLELCMPFSDNDIKEAMFDIPNHKSPGPDSFSSGHKGMVGLFSHPSTAVGHGKDLRTKELFKTVASPLNNGSSRVRLLTKSILVTNGSWRIPRSPGTE